MDCLPELLLVQIAGIKKRGISSLVDEILFPKVCAVQILMQMFLAVKPPSFWGALSWHLSLNNAKESFLFCSWRRRGSTPR